MRTENSIKNSIIAMLSYIISIIVSFIAQAIFIRILGAEYLGLNGLFTNILTMMSIFELGIGNAIVYNLYKPIAENDFEKIKSLMNFYKKSYNLIAFIILILGLSITPFLTHIVGTISINVNIYVIYILFLISTVVSYLIAYKRNLIYANQQNYIVDLAHMIFLVVLNVTQLLMLFLTRNYYLYLLIKIVCQILENIILTIIANKKYPYLLDKNIKKLDKENEKDIFKKVRALIFHKIGGIVINGTDNIIISYFLGVLTVGLYTNYNMIINAVKTLFSQIIVSTTASIGNLLVTETTDKRFKVFKKIRFLNFWIATFASTSILVIMNSFIKIWVGEEYLLSTFVLVVLVLNFYQKMMRYSYSIFKESAGIYVEDKFVPLIESALNIIFSIIFLKIFGLAGVFIGTIISGLALWCYSYPKFIYKKLFNRTYTEYAGETIGYIILFIIILSITYLISLIFKIDNILLQLIINIVICIVIPNLLLILLFYKSDNFKYYKNLIKKILNRCIPEKYVGKKEIKK